MKAPKKRNPVVQAMISRSAKAGSHGDKKKQKSKTACRENVDDETAPVGASALACRVTAAFREAAQDAVAISLRRGHSVVGVVNGVWITKKNGI